MRNQIDGIVDALRVMWCEMDVLWTGEEWILCHDFFEMRHGFDTLRDLVTVLVGAGERWERQQPVLIVDVKWDYVHNAHHCMTRALTELNHQLLPLLAIVRPWVQFSHASLLEEVCDDDWFVTCPLGFVMHQPLPAPLHPRLRFVTVNMSAFAPLDFDPLISHPYYLIGYTCQDPDTQWQAYLQQPVNAVVCDLPSGTVRSPPNDPAQDASTAVARDGRVRSGPATEIVSVCVHHQASTNDAVRA